MPITYFLKTVRFALLSQAGNAFQMDLLFLALTTFATILVGVFKIALYKTRKDGLIDRKEEY